MVEIPQSFTAAQRRRGLMAVIAAMFAIGLHFGIMIPLVAVALEARGVGAATIGLNAAMQPLAILLVGPFLARLAGRLGAVAALLGGLSIGAAAVLAMPLWTELPAWFALRFLMGLGLALPWLIGETWINALATEASRGRVVGLYGTAFFGGLAIGPLLVGELGAGGWGAFLAAAAALVLAGLPIAVTRRLAPVLPARPRLRLIDVARSAPFVMSAAALAGFSETAIFTLLPVYGLRSGLGEATSLVMLTAFTLGAIALQYPLGALADGFDRRRLLLASALIAGICAALLPLALDVALLLWPLLVIWGGVVLGFYTLGLALLGQRFPPADLAVANALFILCYEVGNVLGPSAAGAAMAVWDPHGLAAAMSGAAFLFLALGILRRPSTRPE